MQDVFNGNDVVMLEVLENFQLSQCAFGIRHHFKSVGDLLYRHLLACERKGKVGDKTDFVVEFFQKCS